MLDGIFHCRASLVKIMSNVAIKTEVIQTPHFLVSLDFSHYYVCILFISPLFSQQLIQVDCLEGANFSGVLDQLIQISFLLLLTLFPLVSEVDTSVVSSCDTLTALLRVKLVMHGAKLMEDFLA